MRVDRVFAAIAAGVGLGVCGLVAASAAPGAAPPGEASLVRRVVADSALLVGGAQGWDTRIQGQVAADAYLTVNIAVSDIDDPHAAGGTVEIRLDLAEVAAAVQVYGWTSDCDYTATDEVTCTVALPPVDPATGHVPVAVQAIKLRATPAAPAGPAGAIYLTWSFNGTPEPSTAEIDVVVNAVATTTPPATNPPAATQPSTAPPTTAPVVIKPVPAPRPTPKQTTGPSTAPSPGVTVTPAASPLPTPAAGGLDPVVLGATGTAITFGAPAGDRSVWRTPALWLSIGIAGVGLLIASIFAAITMRRAGRD